MQDDIAVADTPTQIADPTPSDQQEQALEGIEEWLAGDIAKRPVYRLFGYAGTGKTTLARRLKAMIKGTVAYGAPTGKAAMMLATKGCTGAATLHSQIYKTRRDESGALNFLFDPNGPISRARLLVADEASMIGKDLGADLLRYGKPILVLGDPAQLPPVGDAGFFTKGATPDTMLTEIHRQAAENPIIRIATDIRQRKMPAYGDHGSVIVDKPGLRSVEDVMGYDQIIVGTHATRTAFNARIRTWKGHGEALPMPGDRLICTRNDPSAEILNGGMFEVLERRVSKTQPDYFHMMVQSLDIPDRAPLDVRVHRAFFEGDPKKVSYKKLRGTQQFDYGYAITCHKAQGSQWGSVIIYDETRTAFRGMAYQWLYTALTRAEDRATIIR